MHTGRSLAAPVRHERPAQFGTTNRRRRAVHAEQTNRAIAVTAGGGRAGFGRHSAADCGNGSDVRRSRRFGRHADAVSSWRVATIATAT